MKIYSKSALASSYWQVNLCQQDRHKAAFVTLWTQTRTNTFQRILNTAFGEFLYIWLLIYVDLCVSLSDSYGCALEHFQLLSETPTKVGNQFKPPKCLLFSTKLNIPGHEVSSEGRTLEAKGLDTITKMPRPPNIFGLKRFIGGISYFREYIPNMP